MRIFHALLQECPLGVHPASVRACVYFRQSTYSCSQIEVWESEAIPKLKMSM